MAGGISYGSSWVELCNRALARLGKERISSLTTGDELTNYCNIFLGEAIEGILSVHSWNGAKKRIQLAELAITPEYRFAHAYALPVDFVNLCSASIDDSEYWIEGSEFLTDEAEVWITYVARPSDPTILPGYLKLAITTKLAFLLTTPLTSSESLAQRIAAEAAAALEQAIRDDGRRRSPEEKTPFWDEVR